VAVLGHENSAAQESQGVRILRERAWVRCRRRPLVGRSDHFGFRLALGVLVMFPVESGANVAGIEACGNLAIPMHRDGTSPACCSSAAAPLLPHRGAHRRANRIGWSEEETLAKLLASAVCLRLLSRLN